MKIITIACFVYASIEDIRSLRVPVWIFPLLVLLLLILSLCGRSELSLRETGWCFAVMLIYCLALLFFSEIGGADLLALLALPFTLGRYSFAAVLLSDLLCIPAVISLKIMKNEKDYPYLPFLTVSYLITMLLLM